MGLNKDETSAKVKLPSETETRQRCHSIPSPANSTLHEAVMPFAESLQDSQLANLVRLMEGLYEGRSMHLSRIASEVTAEACKASVVRQLTRFLGNTLVDVRAVYEPIARELLARASRAGRVVLIMDCTKVGFSAQLVMVSLAYQGRALPLIWTWLPYPTGHSLTATQVEVLSRVREWLPADAQVVFVGDSEFGRCWLQEELNYWGWSYVLRQSSQNCVWRKQDHGFLSLDQIALRGQGVQWFPHTLLTQENSLPTHLLGYWAEGEKTPWWLATNLTAPQEVLVLYPYRMWTEMV
jgi:hypothetical protein